MSIRIALVQPLTKHPPEDALNVADAVGFVDDFAQRR